MSDSVIVLASNTEYLQYAKSLMVGCIRQGNWKGDFCLVSAQDSDSEDLELRGINILNVPDSHRAWLTKFHIFSPYFKRWKRVLYLDCDILIQGDLNDAFDGMAKQFPSILFDGSSDGSIEHNWKHFDKLYGDGYDAHPEIYEAMRAEFPHVDERILTSDVICYDTNTVPEGTVEALQATALKYAGANAGNADQPVFNLVLYDKMAPITKDFCTWWAFDDPGNRVPQAEKGWRGDETPAILHYWSMYAPWLVKTPDAGAYFNHRLGRVCHELYAENLAAFNKEFPCLTK